MVCAQLLLIFTKIIAARFARQLEESNFFSICQLGFRPGCASSDLVFIIKRLELVAQRMNFCNAKFHLILVMMDLLKAFPSLSWKLVRFVFRSLGLHVYLNWLEQIHRGAKYFAVAAGGEHSKDDFFRLGSGLKEGCGTSPSAFGACFQPVVALFIKRVEDILFDGLPYMLYRKDGNMIDPISAPVLSAIADEGEKQAKGDAINLAHEALN